MALCTTLQSRVLALETINTTQAIEIASLKKRVKKLKRSNKSRTYRLKRLYRVGSSRMVESSKDEGLGKEDASKQGRRIYDSDANEDITLVNDDNEMFDVGTLTGDEDKGKGKRVEPKKPMKKKELIRLDEEITSKLQAEFDEEAKIEADHELAQRLQQKVDDDKETIELKNLMEVMPDEEEVSLDAIPLAVKSSSIVDWKIHKEGKKSYYQIIRANGSSKMYLVFSHMLKIFDRKDLETLYKLVKAKYGSTRPVEDLNLVLYRDLKTMFEPHVEDNV
ncbi:hypothetical protein Tco_0636346 [Tanacetum coccineum]